MVLLHSIENWTTNGDYLLMEISHKNKNGSNMRKLSDKKSLDCKIIGDFGKNLNLKENIQDACLVYHNPKLIALIHNRSELILIKSENSTQKFRSAPWDDFYGSSLLIVDR